MKTLKNVESQISKGYNFRKDRDLSDDNTVVLTARGSEIIDDYGDRRPCPQVMQAAELVASFYQKKGYKADVMGQEKGYVDVFITL